MPTQLHYDSYINTNRKTIYMFIYRYHWLDAVLFFSLFWFFFLSHSLFQFRDSADLLIEWKKGILKVKLSLLLPCEVQRIAHLLGVFASMSTWFEIGFRLSIAKSFIQQTGKDWAVDWKRQRTSETNETLNRTFVKLNRGHSNTTTQLLRNQFNMVQTFAADAIAIAIAVAYESMFRFFVLYLSLFLFFSALCKRTVLDVYSKFEARKWTGGWWILTTHQAGLNQKHGVSTAQCVKYNHKNVCHDFYSNGHNGVCKQTSMNRSVYNSAHHPIANIEDKMQLHKRVVTYTRTRARK